MSARNNAKVAPKPFCKVCHDAGKSEKDYTSHFVKSEPGTTGKVVCPTLLAQECRFCFEYGHTSGYCPVIATNKKAEKKALRLSGQKEAFNKKATTNQVVSKKKSVNVFSELDAFSSDSEPEKKVSKKVSKLGIVTTKKQEFKKCENPSSGATKKEDFPALPIKSKSATTTIIIPLMRGYASVAAKTPEEFNLHIYEQTLIANSMKRQIPPTNAKNQFSSHCAEDYYVNDDDDSYTCPEFVASLDMKSHPFLDWAEKVLKSDSESESDSDEDW